MPAASRLHWTRGRVEAHVDGVGGAGRTLEWVGYDAAGTPIARVIRLQGPVRTPSRAYLAVARDDEGRVIELRTAPPDGEDWLACIGGEVVGRAALPLKAVRTAEAALGARPDLPG